MLEIEKRNNELGDKERLKGTRKQTGSKQVLAFRILVRLFEPKDHVFSLLCIYVLRIDLERFFEALNRLLVVA